MIPRGRYNLELPELPIEVFGALPPENEWIENTYRIWIDFDNPRCRVEYDGSLFCSERAVLKHVPRFAVYLFDGSHVQEYLPRSRNAFLATGPPYLELKEHPLDSELFYAFFEPIAFPVFHGIGLVDGPGCGFRLKAIHSTNAAARFTVKTPSAAHAAHPITLVSAESATAEPIVTEMAVHPDRDFGIINKAVFVGDRLFHEFRIELATTDHGWMPQRWTFSYFSPAGELLEVSQCEVLERHFNENLQAVAFRIAPDSVAHDGDDHRSTAFARMSPPAAKESSANAAEPEETQFRAFGWILLGMIAFVVRRAVRARRHQQRTDHASCRRVIEMKNRGSVRWL